MSMKHALFASRAGLRFEDGLVWFHFEIWGPVQNDNEHSTVVHAKLRTPGIYLYSLGLSGTSRATGTVVAVLSSRLYGRID